MTFLQSLTHLNQAGQQNLQIEKQVAENIQRLLIFLCTGFLINKQKSVTG